MVDCVFIVPVVDLSETLAAEIVTAPVYVWLPDVVIVAPRSVVPDTEIDAAPIVGVV